MSNYIANTVQEIAKDPYDLLLFAFELRKADQLGFYSHPILKGSLKPKILVPIICSNHWNQSAQKMMVKKSQKF